MDDFFNQLIENLTLNDIELLNLLTSQESSSRFSAKYKQDILIKSNMTESMLRKSITRLEAMNFIIITTENRKQMLYVTEYGKNAIHFIYERSNS